MTQQEKQELKKERRGIIIELTNLYQTHAPQVLIDDAKDRLLEVTMLENDIALMAA